MKPAHRKLLTVGAPFLAFMLVGSYGLTYFTQIRYWVAANRKRFASRNPLKKKRKLQSLEEIYQEEVAGKTFDDWENVRAPRPWEPETIRANEEKARKDRERRALEKLRQIEARAEASKTQ